MHGPLRPQLTKYRSYCPQEWFLTVINRKCRKRIKWGEKVNVSMQGGTKDQLQALASSFRPSCSTVVELCAFFFYMTTIYRDCSMNTVGCGHCQGLFQRPWLLLASR